MSLGPMIKQKRLELRLTQQELAEQLGVAQNYVAYLEGNQRRPSQELMEKLAKVLKVPFDQLYFSANPQLENKFKPTSKHHSHVLDLLQQNHALRQRHQITDQELKLLRTVQPLGKLHNEADYLKLILAIRKVYK